MSIIHAEHQKTSLLGRLKFVLIREIRVTPNGSIIVSLARLTSYTPANHLTKGTLMNRRIITGGVLAGLATFFWGAISHIA